MRPKVLAVGNFGEEKPRVTPERPSTNMTPFIIFLIVVTLGYLLYYVAMITIELSAKPKQEGEASENIPVGDGKSSGESDHAPAARIVTETNGSYDISEPEIAEAPEEPQPEAISESPAEIEEPAEAAAPTIAEQGSALPPSDEPGAPVAEPTPVNPEPSEAPEETPSEETVATPNEQETPAAEIEEPIDEAPQEALEVEDEDGEETPAEEESLPTDINTYFNARPDEPQFGVTQMFEPDPMAATLVNNVLTKLSVAPKAGLWQASQVMKELTSNLPESNIEHKDEIINL